MVKKYNYFKKLVYKTKISVKYKKIYYNLE